MPALSSYSVAARADGDYYSGVNASGSVKLFDPSIIVGGDSTSAVLTLRSTNGVGATDYIVFQTGSQVERLRIDSKGLVGIGVPPTGLESFTVLANLAGVTGASGSKAYIGSYYADDASQLNTFIVTENYNNTGYGDGLLMSYARGTLAVPLAVTSGDNLGAVGWAGWDGSDFIQQAHINVYVDGTVTTGHVPARMVFSTALAGGSEQNRLTIDSAGLVGVGVPALSANGESLTVLANVAGVTGASGSKAYIGSYYALDASQLNAYFATENYNNEGFGDGFTICYARGTLAVPLAVQSADEIGSISSTGWDGTAFDQHGSIKFIVDGAVSTGVVPTAITFHTGDGAGYSERLRISSNGNITNGGTALQYLDFGIDPFSFQLTNAVVGPAMLLASYNTGVGADNTAPSITLAKSHTNTVRTHADVIDTEITGGVLWAGSLGGEFRDMGWINAYVDGTPSGNSVPSAMSFATTGAGDQYATTGLTIRNAVHVDGEACGGFLEINGPSQALDGAVGQLNINNSTLRWSLALRGYTDREYCPNIGVTKTRHATDPFTHVVVETSDQLFNISTYPSDGTSFVPTASIFFYVDGAVTTGHVPTAFTVVTGDSNYGFNRLVVDSVGSIYGLYGGLAYARTGLVDPVFAAIGDGNTCAFLDQTHNTSGYVDGFLSLLSRNATPGLHTIVQDGDIVLDFGGWGSDGVEYQEAVHIFGEIDGTPGILDMPGRLIFKTRPDGHMSTPATLERLRIDSAGVITTGGVAAFNTIYDYIPDVIFNGLAAGAIAVNKFENSAVNAGGIYLTKSRSSTIGGHSALQDGDNIASVTFGVSDGTHYVDSALITSVMEATATSNNVKGSLIFSTNGGTQYSDERLRIDSVGHIIVGGTASLVVGGVENALQVWGTSNATAGLSLGGFNATPMLNFYRSDNAALGSATVVAINDLLGGIYWYGAQQTSTFATQNLAAKIECYVGGTVTSGASGDMPGKIDFFTTADGSGTPTQRLEIDSGGVITAGLDGQYTATRIQIQDTTGDDGSTFGIWRWTNDAAGARIRFSKSRGTSRGSNTIVQNNDVLFTLLSQGSDGAGNIDAASIRFEVDGTPGTNDMPTRMLFLTTADGAAALTERLRIDNAGIVSVKSNSLQLFAGTAAIAPLLFASGTNMTTPSVGACEFDGTVFYQTAISNSRQVVNTEQISVLTADRTGTNLSSAQAIFGSTEDVISLAASTSYEFEQLLSLVRSTGTTSHTTAVLWALSSGMSITSMDYVCRAVSATGSTLGAAQQMMGTSQTGVTVTAASTSATENMSVYVRGIIRVNASGGMTPQFQYSATPGGAPQIKRNSFFRVWPIGSNVVAKVGGWS